MAYIDKITNKDTGESRPISPAADKVRVDNENFEGTDLDEVLDEIAEAIEEAGGEGGYTPPQGGIPKTDLAPAVQTSLDKADSAYQKPASGIPATDIADGAIPDVSGLATKTEVQQGLASKVDKTDYTDTDKNKLRSLPANPVTSISVNGTPQQMGQNGNVNIEVDVDVDLEDYYDKDETDAAIATAMQGGVTVINADFSLVKAGGDYYLYDNTPQLVVSTAEITMRGETKTATFKVSGVNLRSDISIGFNGTATNWSVSPATIQAVNGVVNETTVTVTYSGTDSSSAEITVSTTDKSATIAVSYAAAPVLALSSQSIEMSSGVGEAATATVQLTGSNLETTSPIGVAVSGSGFSVAVTSGSLTPSNGAVNATLTITRAAGASDTTGTLTVTDTADGITLTAGIQWRVTETEAVDATVTRNYGYDSADAQTHINGQFVEGTIPITFKIRSVADTSTTPTTPGTLAIVKADGTEAYAGTAAYANLAKVFVPEYITINGKQYDVVELGPACFYLTSSLQIIEFAQSCKVTQFSKTTGVVSGVFEGCSNFKGTGVETIGGQVVNVFRCPDSVQTIYDKSFRNTKVDRLYGGDGLRYINFSNYDNQTRPSYIDLGTSFTAFDSSWVTNKAFKTLVLHATSVVTMGTFSNNPVCQYWTQGVDLYVPSNLVDAYKSATGWSAHINGEGDTSKNITIHAIS